MVLEGDGLINEYPGGYDDWLSQRKSAPPAPLKTKAAKEIILPKEPVAARKLSFKEQRELDSLSSVIEKLEAQQEEIYGLLSDFSFYQRDPAHIALTKAKSASLSDELQKAYERWEYLEELSE